MRGRPTLLKLTFAQSLSHLAVTKSGGIVGMVSVRDLLHPVSIDEF
jgi:hypothetical protein